jgi:hypothetical protein
MDVNLPVYKPPLVFIHRGHNVRLPTVITSLLDFTKELGPVASPIGDASVGELIRTETRDCRIKEKRVRRRSAADRRKYAR